MATMLRSGLIVVVVLAHSVGCSRLLRPNADAAPAAEDQVYLDLLSSYAVQSAELVRIVSDSTGGPVQAPRDSTGLLAFGEFAERLPEDLVSSFVARRNERVELSSRVMRQLPEGVVMRSSLPGELLADPEDGAFRLADGRHAAISTFSRVGFDLSGRRALVHESWSCGPRCGGTSLILLEKGRSGSWHIVERGQGWTF